jgi:hypothetical protein
VLTKGVRIKRKAYDLYALWVKVSPKAAAHCLKVYNDHNRTRKIQHDAMITRDIKLGNWYVNGETIVFSDTASLLNGGNRMIAIKAGGIAVVTAVIFGVPQEYFMSYDRHMARNGKDVADISGSPFPALRGALLSLLYKWRTGKLDDTHAYTPSPEQQISLDNELAQEIDDAIAFVKGTPLAQDVGPHLRRPEITFCFLHFARIDRILAVHYLTKVMTADGVKNGTPPRKVAQKLQLLTQAQRAQVARVANAKAGQSVKGVAKAESNYSGRIYPQRERIRILCAGWNLYAKGGKRGALKVPTLTEVQTGAMVDSLSKPSCRCMSKEMREVAGKIWSRLTKTIKKKATSSLERKIRRARDENDSAATQVRREAERLIEEHRGFFL